MCKISNKLQLCTCKTSDVELLKHYWKLNRPNGKKNCIVGEAMLPASIGEQANNINSELIQTLLNDGNYFDVALQPEINDILELHFSFNADPQKYFTSPWHGNYLAYAFRYKKGNWKSMAYDPFGENLVDVKGGKIKKPF